MWPCHERQVEGPSRNLEGAGLYPGAIHLRALPDVAWVDHKGGRDAEPKSVSTNTPPGSGSVMARVESAFCPESAFER